MFEGLNATVSDLLPAWFSQSVATYMHDGYALNRYRPAGFRPRPSPESCTIGVVGHNDKHIWAPGTGTHTVSVQVDSQCTRCKQMCVLLGLVPAEVDTQKTDWGEECWDMDYNTDGQAWWSFQAGYRVVGLGEKLAFGIRRFVKGDCIDMRYEAPHIDSAKGQLSFSFNRGEWLRAPYVIRGPVKPCVFIQYSCCARCVSPGSQH